MKHISRISMSAVALCATVFFWMACGGGAATTNATTPGTAPTASLSAQAAGKVYTTDPIAVTFSAAMDQASVEAALTVAGAAPVSGTVAWNDTTMTFTPDARWKTHHTYTVTVSGDALDAEGNPAGEDIVLTFVPELNMSDVNGDRIDDMMMGTSYYDNSPTELSSGQAYLFLGQASWEATSFTADQADAIVSVQGADIKLATDVRTVGDIDGDGYADMAMSIPGSFDPNGIGLTDNGLVIIMYGSDNPTSFVLGPSSIKDSIIYGDATGAWLGVTITAAGDVNGDGLADMLFSGQAGATDSKHWLVLGQTERFPQIVSVADAQDAFFLTPGKWMFAAGFPAAACDVDGDLLDDLIIGAPKADGGGIERGEAYVIRGSASPTTIDLRVADGDAHFVGAVDNGGFATNLSCGDIDGDGFGDIIVGAPAANAMTGEAYVLRGGETLMDRSMAAAEYDEHFVGTTNSAFGMSTCVPGDLDDDGVDDFVIGAPMTDGDGAAYVVSGETEMVVSGKPASFLGFCRTAGDVNGDGIDDLYIDARTADGGGAVGAKRGEVYAIFGGAEFAGRDLATDGADVTVRGINDVDVLSIGLSY